MSDKQGVQVALEKIRGRCRVKSPNGCGCLSRYVFEQTHKPCLTTCWKCPVSCFSQVGGNVWPVRRGPWWLVRSRRCSLVVRWLLKLMLVDDTINLLVLSAPAPAPTIWPTRPFSWRAGGSSGGLGRRGRRCYIATAGLR